MLCASMCAHACMHVSRCDSVLFISVISDFVASSAGRCGRHGGKINTISYSPAFVCPPSASHSPIFVPKNKLSITKHVSPVAALKMWKQFHITITSPEVVAIHEGTQRLLCVAPLMMQVL